MEMEKRKRKQRSKERKRQTSEVISPPPPPPPPRTPLVLQNVADVAGGTHTASAKRLEGQHISSSGGNREQALEWETDADHVMA